MLDSGYINNLTALTNEKETKAISVSSKSELMQPSLQNQESIAIDILPTSPQALSSYIPSTSIEKSDLRTLAKDTGFRCFEYSSAITNQSSRQWKIVHEAEIGNYGFLYHSGYPLAAIGHGWGYVIGDIVEVITDYSRYTIVVGDYKAYKDTDSTNKISFRSGCLCEFIVDKTQLDQKIRRAGNVAVLEQYKGYVIDMIKLGSVWN